MQIHKFRRSFLFLMECISDSFLFVLELSTYLLNKKNQNPELCNTFPMYVHFTNRKNPLYVHVRAFYIYKMYKKNPPCTCILQIHVRRTQTLNEDTEV